MQDTRYILLVLLSSLLMLTGCSRRELLDDYPVSGVDIKLDWNGVTDKLPEGVRVIFYPKSAEGRKIDTYLSVRGGKVKVPPGRYSVVAYNYDTETVQIRGEEAYETIEAFTGYCNGLGIAGTEKMVWGINFIRILSSVSTVPHSWLRRQLLPISRRRKHHSFPGPPDTLPLMPRYQYHRRSHLHPLNFPLPLH